MDTDSLWIGIGIGAILGVSITSVYFILKWLESMQEQIEEQKAKKTILDVTRDNSGNISSIVEYNG